MEKSKWQEIHGIFKTAHNDFLLAYPITKTGSNVRKRETAQRKVDNSIQLVKTWMEIHPELIELLVGTDLDEYQKAIKYDDFVQQRYFGRNMTEYLEKMNQKINSM